jgi:hypothetical protein
MLEGSNLIASATAEGTKAGEAAGKAMSTGMKGQLGNLFKGGIFAGAGIEVGRQALNGLEDAIGNVINAIPDMIQKGQEFAVTVHDIEEATGGGAVEASHFAGAIQYVNGSVEGLGPKLKAFTEAIHNNEATFKTWGITTKDASGAWLNTLDILENTREMFSTKLPAGVSKSDMAIKLFGRTGLDFLDFLGLTNGQVAALNQTLDAAGYTLSDTSGAEAAKREWNLFDMVLQGLDNTLTVQLLPTIREVLATATGIIVANGKQIVAVLTDITQSVLGFITSLLGLGGAVPFQATLDSLAGSVGDVTLSKEQWAAANGRLIPTIDKAAAATKAATTAIDNEIKSIDKQIDRSKAADTAAANVFTHTMTRLGAVYQAQLDALDLQERTDAAAQRAHDLNERLNQAQLDLAKAQAGDKGVVDAGAVSDAMKAVADVRAEQAQAALQQQRDAQRASLQSTKDFIAEQATLAGDTTVTQTTKVKTFTQREGTLTGAIDVAKAKGDAATVADLTARLEAVRTAKARVEQANRAMDRQAELGDIKARLEDQRAAMASADSSEITSNKAKLAQLDKDYAKYVADMEARSKSWLTRTHDAILGDPKTGTGLGGAMSKAFTDGQAAAAGFKWFLDKELIPSVQGLLDIVTTLAGAIGKIADFLGKLPPPILQALAGYMTAGPMGALLGPAILAEPANPKTTTPGPGGVGGQPSDHLITDPGMPLGWLVNPNDPKFLFGPNGLFGGLFKAAGGPVRAGMPYIVGERRPELFVPGESGRIIPSLDAMSGAGAEFRITVVSELDGRQVAHSVGQYLAEEYHR